MIPNCTKRHIYQRIPVAVTFVVFKMFGHFSFETQVNIEFSLPFSGGRKVPKITLYDS